MTKYSCIVLLFSLMACQTKTPEQRMVDYINDPEKKITQVITIGNTQATLRLMPDEYQRALDSTRKYSEEGRYYYFNMRFDRSSGDKPDKEKIMYLNFDMQQDFVLKLSRGDSLKPVICQKVENGKGGSYEYLLAFEKPEAGTESDFTVFYNDKIFGTGTLAFVYTQKDINKIPRLK